MSKPTAPARAEKGSAEDQRGRRYWGSMEPPKAKADFFSALTAPTADGDATVATIRMYGPIDSYGGWWGISTEDIGRVLDALPETVAEIVLRINSPGGEVWEAMAILNMFAAHRARVVAVVDGIAASAASFIAASCDETVMSPGSQMMIHSPSSITWGNAAEMRKTAAFLDTLEESMVEVYTAKAGAQDWATLLAEETWLTAARTVELGLADRVDVVPDAGTSSTVGVEEEDDIIVLLADDDPDAEARAARVHAAAATARAAAPKPPSSSEPGEPNRKENVVAYDELKAGFAKRLGVSEADVTDEMLFAALDEALEEQVDPTTQPAAALPAGTRVIDETVLAELQANARLGAEARAEQDRVRRDGIIATAMNEGRITATSRDTWRTALDENEEQTVGLLNGLAKNTLPVSEIGKSDELQSGEAALYESVYGKKGA
ncbi:ATP-dependent protease ClpP, protease subunit [Microbacterium hydrothermale]|uniref:head maturation protease, ClpP-related n=1 Tax=Microbacterium hydrothermale TaxID=857427 RepID=UPI00222639B6|nr:head maturation protease, ClpP-related [Microbacterium hydrothermale]MCW2165074.1 ATP-dependent protease ClpP, protease subunit [Microbacterium hydrothermale]